MQNKSQGANAKESRSCPYLDTVDRKVLDFDLEKVLVLQKFIRRRNAR